MKAFSIVSPANLLFGPGRISELPAVVSELGEARKGAGPVLVLSDRGLAATGLPARIAAELEVRGEDTMTIDTVPPEPSVQDLDVVAAAVQGRNPRIIAAIGGGSVLDAAKLLAAMLETGWSATILAERGCPRRGVPVIAVPTTAGTGSEATPNAILLFPERGMKVGIVSPYFIPDRVILDPELTLGLPPRLTASTGVDAFCHLLECFVGKKANPLSDMMAREGMRLLMASLTKTFRNGADLEARSATMLAAYYGGACIASSGTNAVHALSYPLGGTYRVPHGIANAALLVPVMDFQKDLIPGRLAEAARAMGMPDAGSDKVQAQAFVKRLRELVTELGVATPLSDLGVPATALGELVEAAFAVRRLLDNNPVELSKADILAIYESAK